MTNPTPADGTAGQRDGIPAGAAVDLRVADETSWRFVYGDERPHLHPVTTPAGHVLTREAPDDHPWHHALWFAIKYVDGENFWEQAGGHGSLRVTAPPTVVETGAGSALRTDIDWVRPGTTDVAIRQRLAATAVATDDPDAAIVDLAITLESDRDVELDRTPYTTWGGYGGLTFRGRGELVDTTFLLPGGATERKLVGVPAPWIDLSGRLATTGDDGTPNGTGTGTGGGDGDAPPTEVGITILDGASPGPSPVLWYGSVRSRVYGDGWSNYVNAAFLWDGPIQLPAGEQLRFAYRVIAHDGPADPAAIDAELHRYRATLTP